MTTQIIPTSTELNDYTQTTTLDGRDYIFRFLFNEREDRWYFTLSDQDGVAIVSGLKVVVEVSLLRLVTDSRRPPGLLLAKDLTAVDPDLSAGEEIVAIDPRLNDLGGRVELFYFPEADLS